MGKEEQAFDTEARVRIPGERRHVANAITAIGQAVAQALDVPFDPPQRAAGAETPLHLHHSSDEVAFVLSGELTSAFPPCALRRSTTGS